MDANPELNLASTITVSFPDKLNWEESEKCAKKFIMRLKRDGTGRNWVNDDGDANAGAGADTNVDASADTKTGAGADANVDNK